MPILYKYISPYVGEDGSQTLPKAFSNMSLLTADARSFNDPFEVRPYFDQERHDHFAKTHEGMHESLGFGPNSLTGRCSMVGLPTENAVGFGEELNQRFRAELGKRYRVLCLSRTPSNVLMWGHYTSCYRGFVIGVDTDDPAFAKGIKAEGFEIQYHPDRSRTKLPLAFYTSPSVESYDILGNIANSQNETVLSDGGLHIPFREYRRQVEAALITSLTVKAEDWRYEQEVRFIYDLTVQRDQLINNKGVHTVTIPPTALKEITVGFRASPEHVKQLVQLFRNDKLGSPNLFFSTCHPNKYEVQAHRSYPQYLMDYFETILPNQ